MEQQIQDLKLQMQRIRRVITRHKNYHNSHKLPIDEEKIIMLKKQIEEKRQEYWRLKGRKTLDIKEYQRKYQRQYYKKKCESKNNSEDSESSSSESE